MLLEFGRSREQGDLYRIELVEFRFGSKCPPNLQVNRFAMYQPTAPCLLCILPCPIGGRYATFLHTPLG